MTLDDYNAFCASLPATAHVVQWGGAHVWKVGGSDGKLFAAAGMGRDGADAGTLAITFKAGEIAYEILKDQPGLRPAPYLASRGMKWIQHYAAPGLSDEELKAYLTRSHALAAANLTKKKQRELGLS